MGKFFIDRQPDGWRWYSFANAGVVQDVVRGFKTRKAALEHARAHT